MIAPCRLAPLLLIALVVAPSCGRPASSPTSVDVPACPTAPPVLAASGQTPPRLMLEQRHKESIEGLSISPDGRRLASWDWHSLRIWDTGSLRQLTTLPGCDNPDQKTSWLSDDEVASDCGMGGKPKVYGIESGRALREIETLPATPDVGRLAVEGHQLAALHVRDSARPAVPPLALDVPPAPCREVENAPYVVDTAVSRNGDVVAAVHPNAVFAWAATTGKVLFARKMTATHVAVSGDGRTVFVGDGQGRVRALHAATGRTQRELGAPAHAPDELLFVGAKGDELAVRSGDTVTRWSLPRAEVVDRRTVAHAKAMGRGPDSLPVVIAVLEGNRSKVKDACAEGSFPIARAPWNEPATAPRCYPLQPLADTDRSAGPPFVEKMQLVGLDLEAHHALLRLDVVTRTLETQSVRLDLETGAVTKASYWATPGRVVGLDREEAVYLSSPPGDASFLATWSLASGEELGRWFRPRQTGTWFGAATDSGSTMAWIGQGPSSVTLRQADPPKSTHVHPDADEHGVEVPGFVREAAFVLDDQALLLARDDGSLALFRGGKVAGESAPGDPVYQIAVAPGGRTVAIARGDGGVQIWDVATLSLRATLSDYEDGEWAIVTPAGAYTGTAEVADRIGWVFTAPLEAFAFEQFTAAYRDPSIVKRRLNGEEVDAAARVGRPPRVSLPTVSRIGPERATVEVSVSSGQRVDVVRAFVDGRPEGARAVCAQSGSAAFDVDLSAGNNRVSVFAFDPRGFASNAAVVDVEGPDRSTHPPDIWVAAIGVGNYRHLLDDVAFPSLAERAAALADLQLPAALADARGLAAAIADLAGSGKTYARAHVATVTDDREAATPAAIRRAIGTLRDMAPGDVGFVLLAGHGFKRSTEEDMLFATSDARLTPDGRHVSSASVRDHAIGWRELWEELERAKGRVVVLVDACHAGHLEQALVVPNDALASKLARAGRAGITVFAAAKGRQLSLEPHAARALELMNDPDVVASVSADESEPHGFFTGAVLAALRGNAADSNGDGNLELSELVAEVTERVTEASKGRQTPWLVQRESFGDFTVKRVSADRPSLRR